jgi:hypothetical protein
MTLKFRKRTLTVRHYPFIFDWIPVRGASGPGYWVVWWLGFQFHYRDRGVR